MNTTTNSPLANLTAAEAGLAVAIRTAASAVDEIATDRIDVALARLEESVRACHGRLGAAMGQFCQKIGEVVETIEALAAGIFDDMGTDINPAIPEPIGHTEATTPAVPPVIPLEPVKPVAVQQVETVLAPGPDDHGIELAASLAADPSPIAQKARQETQDSEPTRLTPDRPIEAPSPSCAAGTADSVQAVAACSPVDDTGRDDRKPALSPTPMPTVPTPANAKKGRRRPKT